MLLFALLTVLSRQGFSVTDTEGNPILVPRTSEMLVLGILLDQHGGSPAAMEYRLTAALLPMLTTGLAGPS